MTAMKKIQDIPDHRVELVRPLYVIEGDAAQARADAKALDTALRTDCVSAVVRHIGAEEQIGGEEKAWAANMATFFVVLVGLLKVLDKETGKPPEERSHGAHLKGAKKVLADAEGDLGRIERALAAWERARSDIVRALAAAQKGLPKKGDEAVKAGSAAAKKEHQALVKAEAGLRVWAFKQGKAIETAKKQLQARRTDARVMKSLFDSMPETKGTPV